MSSFSAAILTGSDIICLFFMVKTGMTANTKLTRIENYAIASNALACMSNRQLTELVSAGKPMHSGIGGTSILAEIENIPVFVKQVSVTSIELEPDNFMSTANIFKLPMCYQYGIGSAGFGAWRELAAHIMTTNWVLSDSCAYFPILYGWRIIPKLGNGREELSEKQSFNNLEYWENNQNIAERLIALENSSTSLLLFLEYFPKNLSQYLDEIFSSDFSEPDKICSMAKLNTCFETVIDFMYKNGFLHMDAHFRNILVDGDSVYFSDFGLAMSDKFNLSILEQHFLDLHKKYDRCSFAVNLLHGIITSLTGEKDWDRLLLDYISGRLDIQLPEEISKMLSEHIPVAQAMHDFYRAIQKDKSIPYPSARLDLLIPGKSLC